MRYISLAFEAYRADGSAVRVEAYDQLGHAGWHQGWTRRLDVAYLQSNPLDYWITSSGGANWGGELDAFADNPCVRCVGAVFVIGGFCLTQVLPVYAGVYSSAAWPAVSLSCYGVALGSVFLFGHVCGRKGSGKGSRHLAPPRTRTRLALIHGEASDSWWRQVCGAPRFSAVDGSTQDAELAELLGGPGALAQKLSMLDGASARCVRRAHLLLLAAAVLPWLLVAARFVATPGVLYYGAHVSLWCVLFIFEQVLLRAPTGLLQNQAVRCLGVAGCARIVQVRLSERDSAGARVPVLAFVVKREPQLLAEMRCGADGLEGGSGAPLKRGKKGSAGVREECMRCCTADSACVAVDVPDADPHAAGMDSCDV